MSTAGYLALLAELANLAVDEEAKHAFRLIVEARLRAEQPDRESRVRAARAQLDAYVPRAEICRLLCIRFGVSRAQGYRDIADALNCRSE